MSLHQFNPGRKSWKIYGNTLTSISGDDLKLVPYDDKNLILEASGNGSILFKENGITYTMADLSNVASGGGSSGATEIVATDNLITPDLNAGASLTSGATDNILLGKNTGQSLTTGDNNICLGPNSGTQTNTSVNSLISIGPSSAGTGSGGNNSISIGGQAGYQNVASGSINIGPEAGKHYASSTTDGVNAINIGNGSGRNQSKQYSVNIGYQSGYSNNSINAINIGRCAGYARSGNSSINLGTFSNETNGTTHNQAIVINATGANVPSVGNDTFVVKPIRNATGSSALFYDSSSGEITYDTAGGGATAIVATENITTPDLGAGPDLTASAIGNIFIGKNTGRQVSTANYNVAIGYDTCHANQDGGVYIGREVCSNSAAGSSKIVAIGHQTAKANYDGTGKVFIGNQAGYYRGGASNYNIGIGNQALFNGRLGSRDQACIALGAFAMSGKAQDGNSDNAGGGDVIAIGYEAHKECRPSIQSSIFIGTNVGRRNDLTTAQGRDCVAIGHQTHARFTTTTNPNNRYSTVVGAYACNQGIDQTVSEGGLFLGYGAGQNNAYGNQIVLNGTGSAFDPTTNEGLFVKPIRNATGSSALFYDSSSGEITYDSASGGATEIVETQNLITPDLSAGTNLTSSAIGNVLLGADVGSAITTTNVNVALGFNNLSSGSVGDYNVSIGRNTARTGTNSRSYNICIGNECCENASFNFDGNICLGYRTAKNGGIDTAIILGWEAGAGNTANITHGVVMGYGSCNGGTTTNVIAIGKTAHYVGSDVNGICLGERTGFGGSGDHSILIGTKAGEGGHFDRSIVLNSTGNQVNAPSVDSFVVKPIRNANGSSALFYDSSSGEITYDSASGGASDINGLNDCLVVNNSSYFIGSVPTNYTINALDNAFFGHNSGNAITDGSSNVGVGANSLYSITTGSNNVGVGYQSLNNNTTGYHNVALGHVAGNNTTIGYKNVYIGYNCYGNPMANNEIAIGSDVTFGNGSNTITLGNSNITDLYIPGLQAQAGVSIGDVLTFDGSSITLQAPVGGGIQNGDDASFGNVDISGTLILNDLTTIYNDTTFGATAINNTYGWLYLENNLTNYSRPAISFGYDSSYSAMVFDTSGNNNYFSFEYNSDYTSFSGTKQAPIKISSLILSEYNSANTSSISINESSNNIVIESSAVQMNCNLEILGNISISGDIIPTVDNAFDIGSPEYNFKDLYLSANSLWIGDEIKIGLNLSGTLDFRKRVTNSVPNSVSSATSLTESIVVDYVLGSGSYSSGSRYQDMKLKHWKKYLRDHTNISINGKSGNAINIEDIFNISNDDDWQSIHQNLAAGSGITVDSGLISLDSTSSVTFNNITSNGRVGIGIISPDRPLHIYESTGTSAGSSGQGTLVLEHGNTNGKSSLTFVSANNRNSDYGALEYTSGSSGNEKSILRLIAENDGDGGYEDQVRIKISGSDRYTFESNEFNVLDKYKFKNDQLKIENVTGNNPIYCYHSGSNNCLIVVDSNKTLGDIMFGGLAGQWNGTRVAALYFNTGSDTINKDDGYITFETKVSGLSRTEVVRITSDGKLGIGTTSPSEMLDVSGNINTNANITMDGTINSVYIKSNVTNFEKSMAITNHNFSSITDALDNTFFGYNSGNAITHGASNVGIGSNSLFSNTSGTSNIGIGDYALYNNNTGYNNIGIGVVTLYSNTNGYDNVAIGKQTLQNNNGYLNVAVGSYASKSITSGISNVSIGSYAGYSNTTGWFNQAFGHSALYKNTGDNNVAIGTSAGYSNTSGNNNIYIGHNSHLINNSTSSTSSYSNEIVIGTNTWGSGDNIITLGNVNNYYLHLPGAGVHITNSQIWPTTDNSILFGGSNNKWSQGHFNRLNVSEIHGYNNVLNYYHNSSTFNSTVATGNDQRMELRCGSEHDDTYLFLGTPFNSTAKSKTAIVSYGRGSWSRSYLYFCLTDNASSNSYEVTINDVKMALYTWGDLWIQGSYSNGSDDRLKHNEINISNGLYMIKQLNTQFYQRSYELKDENYIGDLSGKEWYYEAGIIAQDLLLTDFSYVVSGGDYYDKSNNLVKKPYAVRYNDLFVYNIAATQELDVMVQNQQTIINDQQNTINELNTKVQSLEYENLLIKSALNELLSEAGKSTI